ncbi:competence/damage-inducible protein A [Limibacillus halophilus]|uniref:Molybdenum cofactor synthesis domain-containing protein n=1 Tax=Limibacillus halophilus TaxID=1579333 RepID=A0A839SQJ6_9PROT|nr:competence/damage-inducible protein A [Limibacillus halophilus]MBB3065167.1 molybdenum cofactor synthesis domain-containing protein [Limibacillus halophilus]
MTRDEDVKAALLIIGNEILSGRTKDANLSYIGERLNTLGIRLAEVRVVADDEVDIVEALNALRARYSYVFTTGGIGPTHDDITAGCIAKAFGLPLIENPQARALLEAHYEPGQLNAARLRMARTPEGAELIENPVSTAPGFRVENVYVMAGVPRIMQAMFESVAPTLVGGKPLLSRTVVCDLPEGRVAEGLARIQSHFPEVQIGSYPSFRAGNYGTNLVLRDTDDERLSAAAAEVFKLVADLGGNPMNDPH